MTFGLFGRSGRRWRIDRPLLMRVHRWVGLVLAGFLLLSGLTGALLAWNDELEAAINPQLFRVVPPALDVRPMDPLVLRERVQAAYPQALVTYAPLEVEPGSALVLGLSPPPVAEPASPPELPNDQVFVDPYTGAVLGERKWGDITQGAKTLMSFIYRLHYTLALDVVGSYTFGLIALLWTLDCFIGAYLTFPAASRKGAGKTAKAGGGKPWLARWWPSWKVRWGGGNFKLNFDLHRAGGLWVWAMLLVLAWSGVSFNLSEVYQPVMNVVFKHQLDDSMHVHLPIPRPTPDIGWLEARRIGQRLMAEQARDKGFAVLSEDALWHEPEHGTYSYSVRSSRDIQDHGGSTTVVFDADTGTLKAVWLPTGEASGDTIRSWITSLHMAALWGTPFKVFITLMGLIVALLSVTGVVIWWKKRQGRQRMAVRAADGDQAAGSIRSPMKAAAQDRAA